MRNLILHMTLSCTSPPVLPPFNNRWGLHFLLSSSSCLQQPKSPVSDVHLALSASEGSSLALLFPDFNHQREGSSESLLKLPEHELTLATECASLGSAKHAKQAEVRFQKTKAGYRPQRGWGGETLLHQRGSVHTDCQ